MTWSQNQKYIQNKSASDQNISGSTIATEKQEQRTFWCWKHPGAVKFIWVLIYLEIKVLILMLLLFSMNL